MGTTRRDLRTSGDLVMAPRVPHGLAAAVEGLTREVIRHRPEDIYVFAAQHFEELLKLRDEYGAVTNLPGKSTNTAALREMNQSLKKRSGTEKSAARPARDKGGWSMNETARVLERHRSIFGDKGKKVSPEEVRALGNEKENKSRRRDDLERFAGTTSQKRRGSNERFVRRRIPPRDPEPPESKSKSDSNGNPKIISQIPTLAQSTGLLAKDIKSELRKNRNSSRDGRSIRERTERNASERTERFEIAARHSGATKKALMRSSHERSLDKLMDAGNKPGDDMYPGEIGTDNQKHKTDASGRSKPFAKMPRTLSMDRVREFVVEKFRGSESWEELRSTNYVDRVQEVIDEASPSILRRVKELSTRSAGRSRGYESVDESTSTSTRSDKSNQTDDVRSRSAMSASRRSRRSTRRSKSKSKSKTSCADSLEGIETLASETEQLKETRNEVETGKLTKGIPKSSANGLSGESDASDYTDVTRKASASSSISLPAVRPPSSKNHSRSVSRSDSDNLVLPPIPPEAPRSAKLREELVLPSLQIAKEVLRGVENPGEEAVLIEDTAEVELNLPDAPTEEIFKDSLNVTPEIAASPRPDSLEPDAGGARDDEAGDNIAELKSQLNEISPGTDDCGVGGGEKNSGIEERLREIEETEKRIEKILQVEAQESSGDNPDATSVKEKLLEIQEAEERLRHILDPSAKVEESRDSKAEEIQNGSGTEEKLVEVEESENRIEEISEAEAQEIQKDLGEPGIKEQLMEIEETEKRIEQILLSEARDIREDELDDGTKENPAEFEDTENRIEKILDSGHEGSQEDAKDLGMKEKLIEIEETEKKIEKILQPEDQEIEKDEVHDGMKEKLIEIEETEKRIEKILQPEAQETQEDKVTDGMKEKLMEIEETEKRIEKILQPEDQKIEKDEVTDGMKEKLIEIEETEKRIEKILQPEAQETQEDKVTDGMKEKLMEIEETEKRIENIFHFGVSQVQNDKADVGSMKDKLMEIEEAEKRLENIFDGASGEEESHNPDLKDPEEQNNAAPKTPFIPEIPSEYVTTANQVETIEEEEDKHPLVAMENQFPKESVDPADTRKEIGERNETKDQGTESKVEQFPSGTPDSLGNSYVLTEGSPYDIPDSVTTVIIPERQMDTPSSDILEIVLEDDLGDGSKAFHVASSEAREESPEEESREISLRNILDNFGEIVHQEAAVTGSSATDVDYIKNLKTSSDVVIAKKDLGLIAEEDDKDLAEIAVTEAAKDPAAPTLQDIAESEEIVELEETGDSPSGRSREPEERDDESGQENVGMEAKEASGSRETGSPETLEPEEDAEDLEDGNSGNRESVDDHRLPRDRKKRSLETVEPEVTSPTTTAIGSLQQNVTDSATTESTDEVKETTISDDGGNTAVESSVTSPSGAEEMGVRNSESSNEVKETTISDQPADGTGKNLFSLVPQCHGSMPHVPELNLDSLQDITVSSFQLSDDATAEEDSDVGQPQSDNDASMTTGTDGVHESQEHEPVNEEIIFKEKVVVDEDPCTKITAYVTEPTTGNLDPNTTGLENLSIKEPEEAGLEEPEEVSEQVATKEPREIVEVVDDTVRENVGEAEPEEVLVEIAVDVDEKVLGKEPEEANEGEAENVAAEISEDVAKDETKRISEEEPEEAHEEVAKTLLKEEPEELCEKATDEVATEKPEENLVEVHEELREQVSEEAVEGVAGKVPEDEPEEVHEDPVKQVDEIVAVEAAEDVPKTELEEVADDVTKIVPEEVHAEVAEDSVKQEAEEEPEDAVRRENEEGSEDTIGRKTEEGSEDLGSKSLISELETVSLKDFKALEASVAEEHAEDLPAEDVEVDEMSSVPEVAQEVEKIESNSPMRVPTPEVAGATDPEEPNDPLTSGKTDSPVSTGLDPPKAEVVTNDLDGDENSGERMEYHIYVPEVTASEDCSSTTESSTFNSAATKIQAGVRGFLTRRRLQSAQRRSSTLDSVPSIPDSLATDAPHLEPIEEVGLAQAATTIQSSYRGYKARQRLRREDAVQKTTMSVENAFSGTGLQHTGEFHDCLPLPLIQDDEDSRSATDQKTLTSPNDEPDAEVSVAAENEGKVGLEANVSQENPDLITESSSTKEESVEDDSTFGLLVNKYPGLNLVVLSADNDAVLQSQYLNFITSIEEAGNETSPIFPGQDPSKVQIGGFSTLKTNVGVESLPLDNIEADLSVQDSSVSAREPLAVPGSPTGLVIEELSKTEEGSTPDDAATENSSANDVDTGANLDDDGVSQTAEDSLDLPGVSLEASKPENGDRSETGKPEDAVGERRVSLPADAAQDASLGTMSFSMNVDDMLGLGGESDPPSKMKPIFEVTVTPRDLLKLTNRSQGSQASGDRVESPVTMMQIVPKSVEERSDRSEDERETDAKRAGETGGRSDPDLGIKTEETSNHPATQIPGDDHGNGQQIPEASSSEDQGSSDGMSRTFSIEKN